MLPLSDYITIHVPYLPTTKDTINAQTLALCKDGVKLLNYARGELVNTDALLALSLIHIFGIHDAGAGKAALVLPHLAFGDVVGAHQVEDSSESSWLGGRSAQKTFITYGAG